MENSIWDWFTTGINAAMVLGIIFILVKTGLLKIGGKSGNGKITIASAAKQVHTDLESIDKRVESIAGKVEDIHKWVGRENEDGVKLIYSGTEGMRKAQAEQVELLRDIISYLKTQIGEK